MRIPFFLFACRFFSGQLPVPGKMPKLRQRDKISTIASENLGFIFAKFLLSRDKKVMEFFPALGHLSSVIFSGSKNWGLVLDFR